MPVTQWDDLVQQKMYLKALQVRVISSPKRITACLFCRRNLKPSLLCIEVNGVEMVTEWFFKNSETKSKFILKTYTGQVKTHILAQ